MPELRRRPFRKGYLSTIWRDLPDLTCCRKEGESTRARRKQGERMEFQMVTVAALWTTPTLAVISKFEIKRVSLRLVLCSLSLFLGCAAHAQQVEVSTSLVCETAAQVERVIAVYDADMHSAAEQIDAEEHDPHACVVSAIAYIRGPELRTARKGNVSFQIAPILIVGVMTPGGIRSVTPVRQFSLFEVDERTA